MIEELLIALDLPADSENPVLLPEVYSTGHTLGEYMFYAAADKAAVDELNQINENTMKINFTVDVNFRSDTRDVALSEMEDVKSRLAQGDSYERHREKIQMDGPGSLLEAFDTNVVLIPIEAGENWASWIYGSRFSSGEPTLRVSLQKVEGDRTVTIQAYSVCDDFTLEEIIEHWQTLVEKYRNIPIDVFTGPPAE